METVITNEKENELTEILEQYSENWQHWIHSDSCFLSSRQLRIIEHYRTHQSLEACVGSLQLPLATVLIELHKAVSALRVKLFMYKAWEDKLRAGS